MGMSEDRRMGIERDEIGEIVLKIFILRAKVLVDLLNRSSIFHLDG